WIEIALEMQKTANAAEPEKRESRMFHGPGFHPELESGDRHFITAGDSIRQPKTRFCTGTKPMRTLQAADIFHAKTCGLNPARLGFIIYRNGISDQNLRHLLPGIRAEARQARLRQSLSGVHRPGVDGTRPQAPLDRRRSQGPEGSRRGPASRHPRPPLQQGPLISL